MISSRRSRSSASDVVATPTGYAARETKPGSDVMSPAPCRRAPSDWHRSGVLADVLEEVLDRRGDTLQVDEKRVVPVG